VKFGGLKFIEAAHVKDMLAVLRWAENPADRVTGFRVLLLLPGIGPAGAARILDQLADGAEAERLARLRPPPRAAEAWNALAELLTRLRRDDPQWPEELDLVRQWYQPYLEDRYPDAAVREADLDQLQRIAAGSDSRTRFLTDLTLDPPSASSDEAGPPSLDEDYLVLSTIHSAKGREWKAVYVMNVVDGCIPSDMATGCTEDIEEERRLLYVAMTRAEDRLMLLTPQRFYVHHQAKQGDKHVYAIRSRFIPGSVLGYFDAKVWPMCTSVEGVAGRAGQPAVDLKARLRGTWRATGT
jgi:DNA helicase-2/ATP-dependent DNA helicase PcrA